MHNYSLKKDPISTLNNAMLSNAKAFLGNTSNMRNQECLDARDTVLKVLLNTNAMKDIPPKLVSNNTIGKELNISKVQVKLYRNNNIPFDKIETNAKPKTVKTSSFIIKHNDLARLIVNFWIQNSTASPNMRDVKT